MDLRTLTRFPASGRALPVAAALATLVACQPAEPEGLNGTIDEIVRTEMTTGPISGVSVVVARGSRVVHEAGYGLADLENEIPVTPETVFKVGSITKQFTAAAILKLVDDGALSLDDRLTRYLPEYPGYGSEVTVSRLLDHTSGVKNFTTMERWWETLTVDWWETLTVEMSPRRLISIFENEPFDFRPGTNFSYTNSGYILLGFLAEEVSGQPFGGLLNEKLFVPLRLEATSYCDDRALIPNRASGYQVVDGEFLHASPVSMSQAFAAGGVCSSAVDLVRWSRQLARGRVIGRDGYELMKTPSTLDDGTRIEYGHGMAIGYLEGHHKVSHVGGFLGFAGQIAHYDDDDVTIVVLSNTEGANAGGIESAIARVMLGLGDQEIRDILLTPEELEQYVGTYDLRLAQVTVTGEDGRLQTEGNVPGIRGHHTLLYQGDDNFIADSDAEISVTFALDRGRAESVVLSHEGITMRGVRVESNGD